MSITQDSSLTDIGRYAFRNLIFAGHDPDERDLIIGMFIGAWSQKQSQLGKLAAELDRAGHQEFARKLRDLTDDA